MRDTFTIDPSTGMIYTRVELDREARAGYEFVVTATDIHVPSLSSTSSVSVYVSDVNDNDPVVEFPKPYNNTIHVSYQTPVGYIIAQVNADDADIGENGRLKYRVVGGNGINLFGVDENSATVWVKQSMRNIDTDRFALIIIVEDRGEPPRATETLMNIVVNKSLTFSGGSSKASLISSNNVTIVVSVAVVSGVVIVILVVAIVLVKRQDVGKRRRNYLTTLFANQKNLVRRSVDDTQNPVGPEVSVAKTTKVQNSGVNEPSGRSSAAKRTLSYSNCVDTRDEMPPRYDALHGTGSTMLVRVT